MTSDSPPVDTSESPESAPGPSSSSISNIDLKKDGTASKMRSHRGNVPVLPKSKLCPHCSASFTRTTHLNRHLRTHTNERQHRCDTCDASFTRSDLLTRHKRSCGDPLSGSRTRRKSCQACADSKIKCDLQRPCSKCTSRGKECVYLATTTASARRSSIRTTEENPAQDMELAGLTIADLNEFITQSDSSSAFPSSDLANSSLEFLTSSTVSPPMTRSDYTPTDFQSAISGLNTTNPGFSNMYSNDMFEPLLSNIFALPATNDSPPQATDIETPVITSNGEGAFPFETQAVDMQPFMVSIEDEWLYEALAEPSIFAQAPAPQPAPQPAPLPPPVSVTPLAPASAIAPTSTQMTTQSRDQDPSCVQPVSKITQMQGPSYTMEEMHHYLYLFLSAFQMQVPIIHTPTWKHQGKPLVLMGAAKACGALFVKTKAANNFVAWKLSLAREDLVYEFAKNPTETLDQIHLVIAVVLLQTIGLFHQHSEQRTSSQTYHGMLVMMIRSAGMINRNVSWVPPNITEAGSLDEIWHDWSLHEMTKRALWLSYLHDTCHCIYFALPTSYFPDEMMLCLPCEDALWKASTSTEWFLALHKSSSYGNTNQRLTGISMPQALAEISQQHVVESPMPLQPFSQFILIHAILRNLFTVCLQSRLPAHSPSPPAHAKAAASDTEVVDQQIMAIQYALHNWLKSWLSGPDVPKASYAEAEPPFSANALPFYWLGQIAILAYQENQPPFEPNSENNLKSEMRFRLVKQWLRHIRIFLKKADHAPTLFWDELMKIRLQGWQAEAEGTPDDQDGLLGFFPDI